ncbi:radial spoke head 10-like protein b2 [Plakobranchus ocellatus]|uniref:Radial spoke head 10-like protein b2 n=1 Tax=Plakobranchus ocellatus TaxID=259542 RepID=A0AAV3ZKY2_9GAST|nr:radial spoke head 10-like protein b2 [Plakobranchus ocellatus]
MGGGQGEEDDLELIDEATRKFNFWTHQIHIFFVRKFFPGAEKHIRTRKAAEARRVQEARKKASKTALEAAAADAQDEGPAEEDKSPREAEGEGEGEAEEGEGDKKEKDAE